MFNELASGHTVSNALKVKHCLDGTMEKAMELHAELVIILS
jgi:hypothetical protein